MSQETATVADEELHPLVDPEKVEEMADHNIAPDYDPYWRDHRNRIVGVTGPHGKYVATDDLDDRLEIGIQIESANAQHAIGRRRQELGRFIGPNTPPESELHYANDAEFTFGYQRRLAVSATEYVGVAGSVEYNVVKSLKSYAVNVVRSYIGGRGNDAYVYVHASNSDSGRVVLDGTDLPDLTPLERAFDITIELQEERGEHGLDVLKFDGFEVPEEISRRLTRIEGNYPTIRADHVYECDCGFEGTIRELDVEKERFDLTTGSRNCPDCGAELLDCGTNCRGCTDDE